MANPTDYGLFLPTSYTFDVSELYSVEVTDPEFKELLVRLFQTVNNILLATNIKDSGYYDTTEFVNGQLFFPNPGLSSTTAQVPVFRQVFRKVINLGAIGAGVNNRAHNITIGPTFSFTRIYGAVTNTTTGNYLPLPYADVSLAGNIELRLDNTNVIINNATGLTFTVGYVVLEYIKS